jgi:hypothetical protein
MITIENVADLIYNNFSMTIDEAKDIAKEVVDAFGGEMRAASEREIVVPEDALEHVLIYIENYHPVMQADTCRDCAAIRRLQNALAKQKTNRSLNFDRPHGCQHSFDRDNTSPTGFSCSKCKAYTQS